MARIVSISDTHGSYRDIEKMFNKYKADYYLHTGDGIREVELIRKAGTFPPLIFVKGNCDGYGFTCKEPLEREFEVEGKKIYMTHGHMLYVKQGLWDLYEKAERNGYAAVFFGHTHHQHCEYRNGTWFLNPGSAGYSGPGGAHVAILDITPSGTFGYLHKL